MMHPAHTTRNQTSRFGMTLVELLVAMAIIATLAGIIYGTLAGAGETAREARTKQLITRLHTLLTDRYESYRDRRIDAAYDGTGQVLAAQRLHVLRTTMQMELPDRWSDIINDTVVSVPPSAVGNAGFNPDNENQSISYKIPLQNINNDTPAINFVIPRTALNRLYLRKYAQLDVDTSVQEERDNLLLNESAECLYLIIMNATGDGETRGMFKETDVADTDGDGAPEFIDGWGNPIRFIRWPMGYGSLSSLMVDDTIEDDTDIESHDPFDIFRVHVPDNIPNSTDEEHQRLAINLVPLIYSAGPDEQYDTATTNRAEDFRYQNVALELQDAGLNDRTQ